MFKNGSTLDMHYPPGWAGFGPLVSVHVNQKETGRAKLKRCACCDGHNPGLIIVDTTGATNSWAPYQTRVGPYSFNSPEDTSAPMALSDARETVHTPRRVAL